MKKIKFSQDVLPHLVAIGVFFTITVFFFSPVFFKHQSISQSDIQQWEGSSKELRDFREKTGEEGLWASTMFSGMPAYMINVQWSNRVVSEMKNVMALWLPHPVNNIFLALLCYYIMLLAFGVRPYLALTGAIAFGLSSYVIIGLSAGHNARIGAIAFMPFVIAGVHLAFTGRRILGVGVTTLALALHLRENHLQITYYLALVVGFYGLIKLIEAIREKKIIDYAKTIAVLIPAAVIAVGTFFGQLWAITEYTEYSIRGKSVLSAPGKKTSESGLSRDYAFAYNYGIYEPFTLLIPDFYGGSSMKAFVQDEKSDSYKALSQAPDNQTANQLANNSIHYWGPQSNGTAGPYYAGAIVIFLFVLGILFADKTYIWWLVPLSILSIFLSWGDAFSTFNYFMFDYFPGYNKFRSVNFALIIILVSMPLLGLLGVEKLMTRDVDKTVKKKLLIALAATGGLCLLVLLFGGMMSFLREGESQLPAWFTKGLISDRKSLLRGDAFRSLILIVIVFAGLYFQLWKKLSPFLFAGMLAVLMLIDIAAVDKRYFTSDNFKRKGESASMAMTEADQEILKDKSYYRVYNLQGTMAEAHTSYYHNSIGGYHGAKMRRYQDLYDSCITKQTSAFIKDAQSGQPDFGNYSAINMLNVKYFVYGESRNNIIQNPEANGSAWFVKEIAPAKNDNDELAKVCSINTKNTAVINESEFTPAAIQSDSAAHINVVEHQPNYLKYESESTGNGLAVFSEVYYPKGWRATIDGKDANIIRADYVLRALEIPAGKHTIEFKFKPDAYFTGNKITMASSWIMLLVVLGSIGWTVKRKSDETRD